MFRRFVGTLGLSEARISECCEIGESGFVEDQSGLGIGIGFCWIFFFPGEAFLSKILNSLFFCYSKITNTLINLRIWLCNNFFCRFFGPLIMQHYASVVIL